MISLRAWCMRLRELFRGEQLDRELTDELTAHLEMHLADNVRAGMQPEEARRVALLKLGGLEQTKETVRDRRGLPVLEAFLQDASYAVRSLLRSPGITLVALLSLALGIGANTAIFSLMNAVLLKSLPVRDPAQLVLFGDGLDQGISDGFPNPWLYSYPFYREMQKDNQVFSGVAAAFSMNDRIHGFVTGRHEAEPMNVQLVSGTYFPLLGVQAVMGRTLSEQDDQTEGDHPVAVVSYAWWTRVLARDPSALSRNLTIGSAVFSIVGVAPPEFLEPRWAKLRTFGFPSRCKGKFLLGSTAITTICSSRCTSWRGLSPAYPSRRPVPTSTCSSSKSCAVSRMRRGPPKIC